MAVPPWLPAFSLHPPRFIPNVPHPGKLVFPEDELRQTWFERHSDSDKIRFKTIYVGEHRYWQHPATSFVSRQLKLMELGHSRTESYQMVEEQERQEERYRELERRMAMEQMKEIGVEELQTAQDFVDPDNLVKARARTLEEVIELLKLKGIPFLVPELVPKGMSWSELLEFVHKNKHHADFFNLDFLTAHALTSGNRVVAEAYQWIYGRAPMGAPEALAPSELAEYRQELTQWLENLEQEEEIDGEQEDYESFDDEKEEIGMEDEEEGTGSNMTKRTMKTGQKEVADDKEEMEGVMMEGEGDDDEDDEDEEAFNGGVKREMMKEDEDEDNDPEQQTQALVGDIIQMNRITGFQVSTDGVMHPVLDGNQPWTHPSLRRIERDASRLGQTASERNLVMIMAIANANIGRKQHMEQNSWSMLSKLWDEEQKRRNEAPSREELETRHRAHAKKLIKTLQRIDKVHNASQVSTAANRQVWSDLVSLLALRPKSPTK